LISNKQLQLYTKGKNLLVVDDESIIAKTIQGSFSQFFDNIFMVPNGAEALKVYKNNKIDLIISDIEMPVKCGVSLAKEIKKIAETPMIMLSSTNCHEKLIELINIGVDRFFPKPFNFEKVSHMIVNILENIEYKDMIKNLTHNNIKVLEEEKPTTIEENIKEDSNRKSKYSTLEYLGAKTLYKILCDKHNENKILTRFNSLYTESKLLEDLLRDAILFFNNIEMHFGYDQAEKLIEDISRKFLNMHYDIEDFEELNKLSHIFFEFSEFFKTFKNLDELTVLEIEQLLNVEFVLEDLKNCIDKVFVKKDAENIFIYDNLLEADLEQIESNMKVANNPEEDENAIDFF
jgi:DNA-binding response OmpR family regulator